MKRRILSILLALALCLTLLPTMVLAEGDDSQVPEINGKWTDEGNYNTSWYDADEDEFTISTAAQLAGLASLVNGTATGYSSAVTFSGVTITLGDSIDLDGKEWTPIGKYVNSSSNPAFHGTFDGGGHTVSGLCVNIISTQDRTSVYAGLFGYVGARNTSGTVKNLNVIGEINASTITSYSYTGGVVGYLHSGTVENCTYAGEVTGTMTQMSSNSVIYVGGVVGYVNGNSNVTGCLNSGAVSGNALLSRAGGVAGYSEGTVENCGSTGPVKLTSGNPNQSGGATIGGGIVGENKGTVKNCFSTGEVTGTVTGHIAGLRIGGIVGFNQTSVTDCYFLKDTGTNESLNGIGYSSSNNGAEGKDSAAFASGEVAYLLQGEQTDAVWGQANGSPALLALNTSAKPVYKVTFTAGSSESEVSPVYRYAVEGGTVAEIPTASKGYAWCVNNEEFTTSTVVTRDLTVTAKLTQTAPTDAPELASRTTSSITLKEVAKNTNGAAAQYGISTDSGESWTWQDSPAFTGLTSSTTYTFAVRYGATEDGNYVASPASPTAAFSTDRPVVIPTYTPTVEPADNGTTSVTPKNPRQGAKVTITTTPDEGFEVDTVTVTDRSGKPVTVTDNGDGTYSFTQPAGKVTISVTYKKIYVPCDGGVNCLAYHFTDVDTSEWYHEAMDYVVENGLMIGTSETTFEPNATTTRAMLVTVLYRLEGEPEISSIGIFEDVPEGEYYSEAVAWAAANGIVNGYGDGTFGPDDILTREQMSAIMYRYAAYKGYDVTERANLSDFTDADEISDYAVDAMAWVNAAGIINGTSETTLEPVGDATRCQFAAILYRFCENVAE